jgi:hypothetical protein
MAKLRISVIATITDLLMAGTMGFAQEKKLVRVLVWDEQQPEQK